MKVHRRSWHYRWWKWWNSTTSEQREPKNLCQYFWTNVGTAVLCLLVSSGVTFLIGFALYWAFIVNTLTTLAVIGGGTAAAGVLLAAYRLSKWLEQQPKSSKPEKEPGPVRAYLKAKKQRVCPLIEVVD